MLEYVGQTEVGIDKKNYQQQEVNNGSKHD